MTANAGYDLVKPSPEMALRELGGNSARRTERVLQQSRPVLLTDDFRASCQALFTAGSACEKDPEAAETVRESATGNSGIIAGIIDGGFMNCRHSPCISENGVETEPQTTATLVALPIRALQRPGAQIGPFASVPGNRSGRESRCIEATRQDAKLPAAQTKWAVEPAPAAESLVLPATSVLPEITAPSKATSTLTADSYPNGSEGMSPIREAGDSFRPSTDRTTASHIRRAQASATKGNASSRPALSANDTPRTDLDIDGWTSPVRTTPKASVNLDALAKTDASLHQGKEEISAQTFDIGKKCEQARAFSNDGPDSVSAQSKTSKEAYPASPRKQQDRVEETRPHASELHTQTRQPGENSLIRLRIPENHHFGAEIMRESAAMPIGPNNSPGVGSASQSSYAGLADRELVATLDANRDESVPTWIRVNKHAVEAGYQDPELGWVTVRAHAESSGIHAALVPGSMEATLPLSNHLAGLNAYLADHHAGIHPVSISSPEIARDELSTGQGMNHGSAQGDGREQPSGSGTETRPDAARGSRQDSAMNNQQGDAIEPLADFTRPGRTISLVV